MFNRSAVPPYTPTIEIVPPRQTVSMPWVSACRRSTPYALHHARCDGIGKQPDDLLGDAGALGPVRLHPDCVDHRIRPAPVSHLPNHLGDVVVLIGIDHLDSVTACHLEPLRDEVDGDHAGPAVLGHACAHLSDGA
jgi:hypothetical protein